MPASDDVEAVAYRVPRAAELLGLSERYVWRLVKTEEIESFKVGEARLISRTALLAYVKRQGAAA